MGKQLVEGSGEQFKCFPHNFPERRMFLLLLMKQLCQNYGSFLLSTLPWFVSVSHFFWLLLCTSSLLHPHLSSSAISLYSCLSYLPFLVSIILFCFSLIQDLDHNYSAMTHQDCRLHNVYSEKKGSITVFG